jgi:hypothetical protein
LRGLGDLQSKHLKTFFFFHIGGLSAVDADVDAGGEIEDYDETLFRSLMKSTNTEEDNM